MKSKICLFIIFGLPLFTSGQFMKKLGDKVNQKVNQRIDRKTDKAVDQGLDKAEASAKDATKGESARKEEADETEDTQPVTKQSVKTSGLKSFSKFDFVPGERIIYNEDFSEDAVGEFPVKWNTDGSGEIVTLDKLPGKWLDLTEGTKYETPYKKTLPENYTIEFDLLVTMAPSRVVPVFHFNLDAEEGSKHYPLVQLRLSPNAGTNTEGTHDRAGFTSYEDNGTKFLDGKDQLHNEFTNFNGSATPVHVAVWVQKQRYRAWINGVKVYDLPKGISPNVKPDKLVFEMGNYGSEKTNYQYYLSNIKVAEALPDTRSKLITEGKWSTTGILFEVNSDKIQPASYGVLKEIAATIKENPGIKVKIIGHTDSDGEDNKNLELSKRRATAVKNALISEFKVDDKGIETDGLGESKPVADNKNAEGKARNRRVEFIKL